MISKPLTCLALSCALLAGACSGTAASSAPATETKQTLTFAGDCTDAACGSLPSSLGTEPTVKCAGASAAACAWAPSDPNGTVSYRACTDAECPAKPGITCPTGTALASQTCGSENDAACQWSSSCVPPRDTTPCPQTNGCDSQPQIEVGIICKDGSTGAFACVTDGKQCQWEPNCD